MPTLLAIVVALVVSLALESLIEPYVGTRLKALISLVVFFAVAWPEGSSFGCAMGSDQRVLAARMP